jgi:hypothetical protein
MNETRMASKILAQLSTRVARWRKQGGGRGSRVPKALWQAAVKAAWQTGLYATARATRFNYVRLKERWEKASAEGRKAGTTAFDVTDVGRRKRTALAVVGNRTEAAKLSVGTSRGNTDVAVGSSSRFITVQMPAAPPASRTHIELSGRRGDHMRVEVAGDIDIIGLAQAFWERQA